MENKVIPDYFGKDNGETPEPNKNTQTGGTSTQTPPSDNTPKENPIQTTTPNNDVLRSNIEINQKTKQNKACDIQSFYTKNRHYLIMTDGGKPVYSRYGDEVENCGIFATLSAMITKFTIFLSTDTEKENLNIISNSKNTIVFIRKGQLIFIAFSKKNDCISLLTSQLEFLYNQLLSILTSHFFEKLEDNPSLCLTAMSDTEILFEQMIQFTSKTFASIFGAYQTLPLLNRNKLNSILDEYRAEALLCILMTQNEICAISHNENIPVVYSDICLLQNLILANASLRTTESWVPLCLPGISAEGYLQLYCNFCEEGVGICLLTESQDPNLFMKFSQNYVKIQEKLVEEKYLERIISGEKGEEKDILKEEDFNLTDDDIIEELMRKFDDNLNKNSVNVLSRESTLRESITRMSKTNQEPLNKLTRSMTTIGNSKKETAIFSNVLYMVCKNRRMNQYFLVGFHNDFHRLTKDEKSLYREYHLLLDKLNRESKNEKEYFHIERGELYNNIIQQNEHFLIIASFNFFMEFDEIGKDIKEIFKHLKSNESNYFIIFK